MDRTIVLLLSGGRRGRGSKGRKGDHAPQERGRKARREALRVPVVVSVVVVVVDSTITN